MFEDQSQKSQITRAVAQLVARMHGVHEAAGSNPVSPTNFNYMELDTRPELQQQPLTARRVEAGSDPLEEMLGAKSSTIYDFGDKTASGYLEIDEKLLYQTLPRRSFIYLDDLAEGSLLIYREGSELKCFNAHDWLQTDMANKFAIHNLKDLANYLNGEGWKLKDEKNHFG